MPVPGEPLADHGAPKLVGNPDACGTGSKDDYALVAEGCAAHTDGGDGGRQGDGAGPLHIIVENADPVAIAFEDTPSISRRKVLPLQNCMRKQPGDGLT